MKGHFIDIEDRNVDQVEWCTIAKSTQSLRGFLPLFFSSVVGLFSTFTALGKIKKKKEKKREKRGAGRTFSSRKGSFARTNLSHLEFRSLSFSLSLAHFSFFFTCFYWFPPHWTPRTRSWIFFSSSCHSCQGENDNQTFMWAYIRMYEITSFS